MTSCCSSLLLRLAFAILGSLYCLPRLVNCYHTLTVAFSKTAFIHHYNSNRHRAQQKEKLQPGGSSSSRRTVASPLVSNPPRELVRLRQATPEDEEEVVEQTTTTENDSNKNKQQQQQQYTPDGMTMISIASVLVGLVWEIIYWNQFPDHEFDIDTFIALKGIMSSTGGTPENASAILDGSEPMTIRELPALSPAEQLVGPFFGPPSSK